MWSAKTSMLLRDLQKFHKMPHHWTPEFITWLEKPLILECIINVQKRKWIARNIIRALRLLQVPNEYLITVRLNFKNICGSNAQIQIIKFGLTISQKSKKDKAWRDQQSTVMCKDNSLLDNSLSVWWRDSE